MYGASVLQGCVWCVSVAGMCMCCRDVHGALVLRGGGALVLQGCTWCFSVAGRGVCGAFEAHVYQFSAKS